MIFVSQGKVVGLPGLLCSNCPAGERHCVFYIEQYEAEIPFFGLVITSFLQAYSTFFGLTELTYTAHSNLGSVKLDKGILLKKKPGIKKTARS